VMGAHPRVSGDDDWCDHCFGRGVVVEGISLGAVESDRHQRRRRIPSPLGEGAGRRQGQVGCFDLDLRRWLALDLVLDPWCRW